MTARRRKDPVAAVEAVDVALEAGSQAYDSLEGATWFGQDNVSAVLKSASIVLKGVRDMQERWLGEVRASVEEDLTAFQALLGCRSLMSVAKVQADWAGLKFSRATEEGRRLADITLQVADAAVWPLATRLHRTADALVRRD